ncbi:MAG: metalloregulator ArsR/SmtB family transcription factor [Pseudomonadota bacterium]
MARLKTTNDVFNAIAEPKRRALIEIIAGREMAVGDLVEETKWPQPAVSKHLAVLREVGLVTERREGRCRIYTIQPDKLRPIHEWIHQFEKYWGGALEQLETYLDSIQDKEDQR